MWHVAHMVGVELGFGKDIRLALVDRWGKLVRIWKRATSNRTIGFVLSWFLGIILAGIVILWLGGREVLFAVQRLQGGYLGLAVFVFLLGTVLRLAKWQAVMCKEHSFGEVAIAFLASKLWGSFLPARLGEFAPLAIPRYRTAKVSALIVIDRVFESYATLLAGAIGFVMLGFRDQTMVILWVLVVVIISIGFFAATYSGLWRRLRLAFGEGRLPATILLELERISGSLRTLGRYWGLLLTLSSVATVLDFVFIQVLFFGLNQTVSLPLIAVAWCASVLAALVALTPGGLGIADASYLYIYHLQGVPSTTLGAFFVLNRGISMSMPVLLFFVASGLVQGKTKHA